MDSVPSATTLTERAKTRLRLAAALLRANGDELSCCRRASFYDDLLRYLATLPPQRRHALRELVAWVEAYEAGETRRG